MSSASLPAATSAAISSFCRAVSGFTFSNQPSIAGVWPSSETRRVERLDQVPHRAVDIGLEAGMNVLVGPAAPFFAAGDELQLDRALGPEQQRDLAIDRLAGRRDDDPDRFLQCRADLGLVDDLGEVGRGDFLLAFGDEHQIDRQLDAGRLERAQRGQESRLRALLVDRAAADQRLAFAGAVDDPPFERRRRPFRRVIMLDVVHEVDRQRVLGAGVERRENARHAVGRNRPWPAGSRRRAPAAAYIPRLRDG